jgi:succinyl-CoA synthetase alpha subunit
VVEAGIRLMVVATEYVPVQDAMRALAVARARGAWVIGPNCLGILSPGIGMLCGLAPGFGKPGPVGVISRSGTLALTMTHVLTQAGLGQSSVVSIGGDAVIGRNPHEYAALFEADPATRVIVLVTEIGGRKEYGLIETLATIGKPVVALVVGRNVPAQTRMGHAGALVSADAESAASKRAALRAAGVHIADSPYHVAEIAARLLA